MSGRGLDAALTRYRRRHRRALTGHHVLMNDFATGRPFNPIERTMFAAAARDDAMARHVYGFASRQVGPVRFLSPAAIARAASVNFRRRSDAAARPDSAVAA